jgi:hypothetical protein
MKVFLHGYESSKKIINAADFLLRKYIPKDFEIFFLNYGKNEYNRTSNSYIALTKRNVNSKYWSKYLCEFLKDCKDDYVIFALDDHLLSKPLDLSEYDRMKSYFFQNSIYGNLKLGISPSYRDQDIQMINATDFYVSRVSGYPVTTQWTLWRREVLISILERVGSPWEFELVGSELMTEMGLKSLGTKNEILNYPECSAISRRSKDMVSVLGNQSSDVLDLIDLGFLKESELIMGQWEGEKLSFSGTKGNQFDALQLCPADELTYYQLMLKHCLDPK